jgi:putative ABC transport system permease protein
MDPGVQYAEEHKPLRDTELNKVKGIEGVAWAVPLYKCLMTAKMPDGLSKTVDVTGLDDSTLIGAPYRILHGSLSDFKRDKGVFVDYEAAQSRLRVEVSPGVTRPLAIGDILEISDKQAVIVGFVKATRNFVLQPQIYTTYSRSLTYGPINRRQLTYILVKAKEDQDLQQLCQKIERSTSLKAYTANDFSDVSLNYWMDNTGIPVNFGISVLLGFIVGAAIAGQTFYSFVQENIKHYAALKAMGLRSLLLAKMVILQAGVVGLIGYGIGVGLTTLFGLKFYDSVLAFRMPPILLFYSALGVFLIIFLAATLGIRRVIKVDPAVVFRG